MFIFVKLYEFKVIALKVLIIDFLDSFTYNLSHYLESLGAEVVVCPDELLNQTDLNEYTHIVLSPGPGLPKEKKNLFSVVQLCLGKKPILGVCLGMQGIAEFSGGELYNLDHVKHGVSEELLLRTDSILFNGLPVRINAGLYHSWAVRKLEGTDLIVTAENKTGVIMGFEDAEKRLFGVQFHPESIMTDQGKKILYNFLNS